ncbi:MAG: GNAT family N-acetyltransferase [Oligoflexia bacterium]|nr:GNAT family N-acetyltransferase [Oligoflexia bacterium]
MQLIKTTTNGLDFYRISEESFFSTSFQHLWDEFLAVIPHNFFHNYYWQKQCWEIIYKNKGSELHCYLVKRAEEVIAILPLYLSKNKNVFKYLYSFDELRLIGDDPLSCGQDHHLLISGPHKQQHILSIMEFLFESIPSLTRVRLGPFRDTLIDDYKRVFSGSSWEKKCSSSFKNFSYPIQLKESLQQQLKSCSKKFRSDLSAKRKKLTALGSIELLSMTEKESVSKTLQTAISWFTCRSNKIKNNTFEDPTFITFIERTIPQLVAKQSASVLVLKVNDDICGCTVNLNYNHTQTVCYYNFMNPNHYTHLSIGQLMLAYTLEENIKEGKQVMDLWIGDSSYKEHWTPLKTSFYYLDFYRSPLVKTLFVFWEKFRSYVHQLRGK